MGAVNGLLPGALIAVSAYLVMTRGGRRAITLAGGEVFAEFASERPSLPTRKTSGVGRRSKERENVQVVVAQVAALLRAGATPGAAWTRAAGVPVDGLGAPDVGRLGSLMDRGSARAIAAATRLALTVGAPLGRVLGAVSAALTAEAEAAAEREAALAGPRTTARILLGLPLIGLALGWVLGADPISTATDGGFGTAALLVGLLALAAGRYWTGRLIAAARRAGSADEGERQATIVGRNDGKGECLTKPAAAIAAVPRSRKRAEVERRGGPTRFMKVGGGLALLIVARASPLAWGAALGVIAGWPWLATDRAAHRRCSALITAAPSGNPQAEDALDVTLLLELLAAALMAGAGIPRALAAVADAVGGPDATSLRRASAQLLMGATWPDAWVEAPVRLSVIENSLRPAWQEGAAPSAALAAAGNEVRRARRDAARVAAGRLSVRLVLPLGACFLPAFVLVGLVPVMLALGVGLFTG